MMKRLLFTQGAALLLAASAVFVACGGSEDDSDPKVRYCQQLCDCNQCSDDERASCKDDITNLQYDARDENCEDDFNTYVTCLVNDVTCSGGEYDVSTCSAEELDVSDCIKPTPKPPTCKTTQNGVCDEPEGTGTCPEGSDKDDCTVKNCPTTNDGVCDEASGECPPGTDVADCSTCAYANDGTCDEPEGTGFCEEGSDPLDCATPACVRCFDYLSNPKGELCSVSNSKYNSLRACACGASCASSCDSGLDMCAGYAPGSACYSCMNTYCSAQYGGCVEDSGK